MADEPTRASVAGRYDRIARFYDAFEAPMDLLGGRRRSQGQRRGDDRRDGTVAARQRGSRSNHSGVEETPGVRL